MSHFFAMGGYAAYVWPAYAVFFIVLLADTLAAQWRRRRELAELRRRMNRQTQRQERTARSSGAPPR
ncbi:heme exporter protein CcmD [Frateuria aurantia]